MKHLILGGVRSGKSRLAEKLATESGEAVLYVATAEAFDAEMKHRISLHQQQRSSVWSTIECPLMLSEILTDTRYQQQTILIDCMTLWLNNWIYLLSEQHSNTDYGPSFRKQFERQFSEIQQQLIVDLQQYTGTVIIVSNEVGFSITPDNPLSRVFADYQGWLNQALAEVCDTVRLVAAGLPLMLKESE